MNIITIIILMFIIIIIIGQMWHDLAIAPTVQLTLDDDDRIIRFDRIVVYLLLLSPSTFCLPR